MKYFIMFTTKGKNNNPVFLKYVYHDKKICEESFYNIFKDDFYCIMGKESKQGKMIIIATSYPIV
jgi:hypothetical protein